jgi:hypothetical protein
LKSIQQNKTALYFFVTSFCTLLYGLYIILAANNKNVLLHLFGDDIIIDKFELTILFKIALLVLSIGYFVVQRLRMPLVGILTRLHVALTIGSVVLSALMALILPNNIADQVCFWLIVIALASQVLFVVNIIGGVIKRKRQMLAQ